MVTSDVGQTLKRRTQKHTLPIMQSCVIVLLKLLLATVTGPGAPGGPMQAPIPFASPTTEQPRELYPRHLENGTMADLTR